MTAVPPAPDDPSADDTQAVRTAAQWLVAAAGAVGAVLIAGLQIGDLGRLVSAWPPLVLAIAAFAAALLIVGQVIRLASRVLVVSRATISDLLRAQTGQSVRTRTKIRIEATRRTDRDLRQVHQQIENDQAWLHPDDPSVTDLFLRYEALRKDPASAAEADELHRRLTTICAFARGALTRMAYQRLSDTVTGWPGWVFLAAVIVFAVSLGWPVPAPVTAAYRVEVLLKGKPPAGLGPDCRPGSRLTGVALGGSLAAPEVITEPAGDCAAARFTVTGEVGFAFPVLDDPVS
jgi:membrane protein YdbS with pleckstrin-like domain